MRVSEMALAQGMTRTRSTLVAWNDRPWPILGRWVAGSFAIALALLGAVWLIADRSTPDPTVFLLPGLHTAPDMSAVGDVLIRNSLVISLHAMACVAGFIAGSSLPLQADHYSGLWRTVHAKAGPLAILFVIAATTFSLMTQAYYLGANASTLANQLDIPMWELMVGILPHAIPELVALFLPLAAWMMASRNGDWDQLLAATFATVALAVPVLIAAAFIEVYVSPDVLRAFAGM